MVFETLINIWRQQKQVLPAIMNIMGLSRPQHKSIGFQDFLIYLGYFPRYRGICKCIIYIKKLSVIEQHCLRNIEFISNPI